MLKLNIDLKVPHEFFFELIYLYSLDKLELSYHLKPTPMDIATDFVNNTFLSDVIINLTSNGFKGRFKIEYVPGR